MRRFFSVLAVALVLGGGFFATAWATGSNDIPDLSNGVNMVGNTLQSTEVIGTIGWLLIAFICFLVYSGHVSGGLGGMFVSLIAIGFLFNGQPIAEAIGWSALAF